MKISKTLFKTEIEFTPEELRQLRDIVPPYISVGLLFWIKRMFGLDMLPKFSPQDKGGSK